MRVAAMDLGTNTFLLLVADVEQGKIVSVLHDEVRVVRLGQGVHESRRFHPEAMARAEKCFADFSETIRNHGAERLRACATSAARDVENGQELIDLGARHGIPVEIVSGNQEAELTFWGTITDQMKEPVLIIDVGGGSTEFILGDEHGLSARKSIDVGSVRLTEMFVTEHPIPALEIARMTAYIQERINGVRALLPIESASRFVAVAGTPTTLATLDQEMGFESDRVDGYVLSLGKMRAWVQRLANMSVEERRALAGMEPKRADVIVAGSLVLMLAMQSFHAREITVSVRGLRYGLARKLEKK